MRRMLATLIAVILSTPILQLPFLPLPSAFSEETAVNTASKGTTKRLGSAKTAVLGRTPMMLTGQDCVEQGGAVLRLGYCSTGIVCDLPGKATEAGADRHKVCLTPAD